jgi:dihydrofolate reductase
MLTLIVARGADGAIGKAGTIPWQAPEDLALFQRETTGGVVIMGRKTWDSLPIKPLPRRTNIVVTSAAMSAEGAQFMPLDSAISFAKSTLNPRLYGIGGAGIYRALMPLADRMLITEVDIAVPDADTFFPSFDESLWHEIARYRLRSAGPAAYASEWLRRRA